MSGKPSFWKRVALQMARKPMTDEERTKAREAVWGIVKRIGDYRGYIRQVTAAGMHLTPQRQFRREVEKAGLVARSGRQWVKLRKHMLREEKGRIVQKEAA